MMNTDRLNRDVAALIRDLSPFDSKHAGSPSTSAPIRQIEAQLEKVLRQMAGSQSGEQTQAQAEGGGAHHSHQASHHSHKDDSHAAGSGDVFTEPSPKDAEPKHEAGSTHRNPSPSHSTRGADQTKPLKVGAAGASGNRGYHAVPPTGAPAHAATNTAGGSAAGGDHSRETLAAGHGWGAANGGVTGGSKADAAHVYTVTNRAQLLAALGGNNATNGSNATPKIIQIKGNIDLNTDDSGKELSKSDFANEKAQLAHDMLAVGSNTTIIGLGANAGISGGGFNLSNSKNVAVRNLTMTSPFDFFPGKDAEGNPHGRVYSIEAKGSQNVWIDHNSFKDGKVPVGAISGDQVDFTDGANYATISNNQFLSHNKSILIGSSDGMTSDAGKLKVTIDHNLFAGVSQRDPRVRFGDVEVANNLYQDSSSQSNRFQYNLGVGVNANITSQNNAFQTQGVNESSLVKRFGSSGHLADSGSLVNGKPADLSVSPTDGGPGAGGLSHLDPTADVAAIVLAQSGAGRLGLGD
jgi:pectate lyase